MNQATYKEITMISLLSFLILTLSLGSFAQDIIYLNSAEVDVRASEAILVRTSQTPAVVRITFQVPMANSVCQGWSQRTVIVTSGARCGYGQRISGYTTRTVCVRRNPNSGECVNQRVERVPVYQTYPLTCPVTETYCSSYGTVTSYEADRVKIKFKNVVALGGSEVETFLVKARQRRYNGENVVYDITPLETIQTYVIKDRGFLGQDSYVIQPQ
jgi:hypothetical protein